MSERNSEKAADLRKGAVIKKAAHVDPEGYTEVENEIKQMRKKPGKRNEKDGEGEQQHTVEDTAHGVIQPSTSLRDEDGIAIEDSIADTGSIQTSTSSSSQQTSKHVRFKGTDGAHDQEDSNQPTQQLGGTNGTDHLSDEPGNRYATDGTDDRPPNDVALPEQDDDSGAPLVRMPNMNTEGAQSELAEVVDMMNKAGLQPNTPKEVLVMGKADVKSSGDAERQGQSDDPAHD